MAGRRGGAMAKLTFPDKCPNCDSEMAEHSRFCKVCGHDVTRPAVRSVPSRRGILIAAVVVIGVLGFGVWTGISWMADSARRAGGTGLTAPRRSAAKVADEFVGKVQQGDFTAASKLLAPELEATAALTPKRAEDLLGASAGTGYTVDFATNGKARVTRATSEKPYMLMKLVGNDWRITEVGYSKSAKRTEVIKFDEKTQDDPSTLAGTKKVSSEGANGSQEIVSETSVVNGVAGTTSDVSKSVKVAPVSRVVLVGTSHLTGALMAIGPISSDPSYGPEKIGPLKGSVKVTDVQSTQHDDDTLLVVNVHVENTGARPFRVTPVAGYRTVAVKDQWGSGPWGSNSAVLFPSMKPGYGLQGSYSTGNTYLGTYDSSGNSNPEQLVAWPGKPVDGFFTITLTQAGSGSAAPPVPTSAEELVVGLALEKEGYDASDSQWSQSETRTFLAPMSTFWAGNLP